MGKNNCKLYSLIRDLYTKYIQNSYESIIKRQVAQLKMNKGSKYAFLQGDIKMINKYMKGCSRTLDAYGEIRMPKHCWWECKLVHIFWKTVWQFL